MWLITFTRQSRSQSSSSRSGGPPGGPVMPALEKNASIGATVASASSISSRRLLLAPRRRSRTASPPISVGGRSSPRRVQVGDGDLGPLVGEAQRAGAADPARPARDHDVPARQLHGAGPYSSRHGDQGDPAGPPAARRARRRRLRAGDARALARRGQAARPQPLHERRSVHARAHERPQVLRAAVRARQGDAGRRRRRARGRVARPARARLARARAGGRGRGAPDRRPATASRPAPSSARSGCRA